MRWLPKLGLLQAAGLIVSIAGLTGCTDPGNPWGTLDVVMEAQFDADDGRLDEEGRLKTSSDFAVDLEVMTVTFDAVTVVLAGSGSAGFDPANPPEGYSLCHNGHCHAASGELVDYEVIALEIAGVTGGARVSVALDGVPHALSSTPVAVGVQPCEPSPCELPMGEMAAVEVTVASLRLEGTAFDRRTGDAARLGPEGVTFSITIPLSASPLVASVEGSIGPGEPVGVGLSVGVSLPSQLFDQLPFDTMAPDDMDAWQSGISAALEDHVEVNAILERY